MFKINSIDVIAIRNIQGMVHSSCVAAGWYNDVHTGEPIDRNTPEMLALVHSEVSEALEGFRKDKDDDHLPHRKNFEVELADAMIRIFDLAGYHDLDLAGAIEEKFNYNQHREDHKPENRRKDGGKKI